MIRLFVVAEPRIPLKDWEVSLLQDIYKYWPRPGIDPHWIKPAKNMNDETAGRILYLMGRDRNIHVKYPMLPEKHEVYGYADWIPILKAVYKKKKQGPITQLQWDTRQWKTLATMADHQQIKSLEKWFKKNTRYNINTTDKNGKTLLERQTKKNNTRTVAVLLDIPNIIVSAESIANIEDHELKNKMIRMRLQRLYLNSSGIQISRTPMRRTVVREECGHYSMNQGNVGICYIVSVITLFRNEKSILTWLKSEIRPEPLKEIIALLDADYSSYDFTKQCPRLPAGMVEAVTQNRSTRRGALIKNGGNAYVIMMYILNMIDLLTDKTVYFGAKQVKSGTPPQGSLIRMNRLFDESLADYGYVDFKCDIRFDEQCMALFDLMFGDTIKGFIFRLMNSEGTFNHVIAGCVCDGDIHICNSWGHGCQTNMTQIVNDITQNGSLKLYLVNIAFLYVRV